MKFSALEQKSFNLEFYLHFQVLREQLSKSMMSLVKSGRVSVSTVEKGDNVMVVWNEDHK